MEVIIRNSPIRDTKILFCGYSLKCFSPLKGTNKHSFYMGIHYPQVDHVSISFVERFLVLTSLRKEHFQACWSACIWDYHIILHMFNMSSLLLSLHPCYSCTVCFLYCVTNYYRDSLHVVCLIPPKVDGWTEIQQDLEKHTGSQWFTVIFIFLGHFIFTNLFIGIIIMASTVLVLKKWIFKFMLHIHTL